jgi:hypothetical protein
MKQRRYQADVVMFWEVTNNESSNKGNLKAKEVVTLQTIHAALKIWKHVTTT